MNRRHLTAAALTAAFAVALVAVPAVLAVDPDSTGLGATAGAAYGNDRPSTNLPELVGNVISTLLGFIGVVFILLLIYGGAMWMTAQGDDTRVKKAKLLIGEAVVGMIVIFAAYSITNFVVSSVLTSTETVVGDTDGEPTIEESAPEGPPQDLETACALSGGTWDGSACNY